VVVVETDSAVAVGRVLQHRKGGPDLGQRYDGHALGGCGVDRHSGGTEAAVEQDLGERAAGRVPHDDRRPVQLGDDLLQPLFSLNDRIAIGFVTALRP
jgi:hypothetical protein